LRSHGSRIVIVAQRRVEAKEQMVCCRSYERGPEALA
jgi:hypothetical protein